MGEVEEPFQTVIRVYYQEGITGNGQTGSRTILGLMYMMLLNKGWR